MEPTTFRRPEDFRAWLERHHDSEPELWVVYYKKDSGKPSMTRQESVAVVDLSREVADDPRTSLEKVPVHTST